MSFNDKYLKLRKERLGVSDVKGTSFDKAYAELKAERFDEEEEEDIAPVRELTNDDAKKAVKKMMSEEEKEEDEDDRKWFQKGAFEDGYQFGDITKTIFGSDSDLANNVTAGILGIGEKVVDTGATIVGGVAGLFGNDKVKDKMADFAEKDLYDEHKVAEKMNSIQPTAIIRKLLGVDAEDDSVFGEKTDDLAYSGGQLVGTVGLQSVGVPWYVTTGATSFGGAMEGALREGATFEEAAASSAISAGAEILSEKLFGGSGLGETGLINLDGLTKGISNKAVKTMIDYGIDMAAESAEEIFSDFFSTLGQQLTYEKEATWDELLNNEEAMDSYIRQVADSLFGEEARERYREAAVGGAVLGGGMNVGNVASSIQSGKDYRSGLTANEEAVVNKVYEDRIAEAKENGETLTAKEKDKIYEEVVDDLNMGFISIEDIEGALGGDTYMEYKNTLDEESELQREFDELGDLKKSEFTAKQDDRYNELKQKLAEIKESGKSEQLKAKLGEDVFGLAKGSLLENSYNERANRGRAFDADLNQYDAKQQEIVKKAIDSGILNNSNRTHQFVDIVAKISADKGVSFDFVNNAKLKESGFALDGKVVNGFVTKDGISINIDSPKAWQSTVGHEITHVLEGTELYGELQTSLLEYAEAKGDLKGRRDALAALYDGVEGADVDAELTADLVGDYLFTDSDFINNLSTQHRNVFRKVYDEIKYLGKVVTAGSKEARQLEKVRHAFEKAYRESGEASGETKYSLSDSDGKQLSKEQQDYFKDSKMRDENGNLKVMYHGSQDAGFHVFDPSMSDDDTSLFFVDRNDVAASYSGVSETYEAKTLRTAEDFYDLFYEIEAENVYEVKEENGKFVLYDMGDAVAESDTAQGLYEEWTDYAGVGYGNANYKVYLNLKNPYIVDGKGNAWNDLYDSKVSEYLDFVEDWPLKTRDFAQYAKENDYDGVIFKNIHDNGGYSNGSEGASTVAIAFDSNQIKSVANEKPTGDADIRYSLSAAGEAQKRYGSFATPARDLRYEAPVREDVAPVQDSVQDVQDTVQNVNDTVQDDDFAPVTEDMANAMQDENMASLTDADAPPEVEAPFYGEGEAVTVEDPFENRDFKDVGNRKVKAYMYENPEVKPFFQAEANVMLGELRNSTKGERFPIIDQFDGYIRGYSGVKRNTSQDIAYLLDEGGYTYDEIEKGLKAIIEDHGAENNAVSKRIEFLLNDRLLKGNVDFETGMELPPNQEYIDLLNEKQITEYNEEAFKRFMETADQFAPPSSEDIGPVKKAAPIKEAYEAIRPPRQSAEPRMTEAEPRMKRADNKNMAPDGMEERSWYETSTGSEAVDGMVTPDDIPDDVRYYQVKSNKKTLDTANARLAKDGYAKSREYFEGRMAERKLTVEDIALGERLIQEAAKAGDAQAVRDLIIDVSILGTELGQRVQALSIIRRLTPEGQLKALIRTVERGKAKGDKVFDGVEVTEDMTKSILDTKKADGTFDQAELDRAVEDVKQQIADQMSVSIGDKINAWRYLSMLGNPKTHIRNIVSNVAMFATRQVKNAVARTIEDIAPVKNRTKTWRLATEAVKAFAKNTTADQESVIKGDNKYSDEGSIKAKRKIFGSKIVNGAMNFNTDSMEAEDWIFSRNAYRTSLQEYLTANGIKTEQDIKNNPELVTKAKEYALEEAKTATFRQDSYLANKISEIEKKNPLYGVAVGSIMPFKKTPINIAKTGAAYSPLGFARNIYDAVKVSKGEMDASEAIDHLAQTLTGTSLALIGYALAEIGFLNGAGDDDKEGKYDYQLGKQSYSFNFGGDTYSLSWLSPVAMPLFVGANAYETLVEKNEWDANVVIDTLGQTLDPMSEMSFLSSLDDVLSSYDSGIAKIWGAGESMVQNYATQFVPTALSQIASAFDDTKRSTRPSGDSGFEFGEETLNKIKYKIPGLRNTLEPTTDIWGNDAKQSENGLVRGFDSFLSPANKRAGIGTAVDDELKALYGEVGKSEILPAIPYDYINFGDTKYDMSAKDYTEYKQTYGQTAYDLMESLFETNTYRNATSDEKADMVADVYDYARDAAKKEYLGKQGVNYTNAEENNVKVFKENPINGAIAADLPVDEYTFSQKYPEKYNFFKANGITYDDYDAADEDGKRAYTWAADNPEKYTLSKAVTDDLFEYRKYTSELYDLKADKDEDGKSISGSAKEKKKEYIFNLDLDYGQKIILYRSLYDSQEDKNTYNADIVHYLDSREDISLEEMITILEELGMKMENGYVTWD